MDTVSVLEASQVLGITKRRVLQLLAAGKLEGTQDDDGVWAVSRTSVLERLRRLGDRSTDTVPRTPPGLDGSVGAVPGGLDEGEFLRRENHQLELALELQRERSRAAAVESEMRASLATLEARVAELQRENRALRAFQAAMLGDR